MIDVFFFVFKIFSYISFLLKMRIDYPLHFKNCQFHSRNNWKVRYMFTRMIIIIAYQNNTKKITVHLMEYVSCAWAMTTKFVGRLCSNELRTDKTLIRLRVLFAETDYFYRILNKLYNINSGEHIRDQLRTAQKQYKYISRWRPDRLGMGVGIVQAYVTVGLFSRGLFCLGPLWLVTIWTL